MWHLCYCAEVVPFHLHYIFPTVCTRPTGQVKTRQSLSGLFIITIVVGPNSGFYTKHIQSSDITKAIMHPHILWCSVSALAFVSMSCYRTLRASGGLSLSS